jgi:hypothetical protein
MYSSPRVKAVVLAVVVAVAGAGGCKKLKEASKAVGEHRAPAEDADVPEPPTPVVAPRGKGLAPGRYHLEALRVEARPTNGHKERWDPADEPDPELRATLVVDGTEIATCTSKDSVVASCRPDVEVAIARDTEISLAVVDVDAIVHDEIGSATLRNISTWDAGVELPMQPAGRLWSATLRFARIPTWWEVHRAQLTGLGIGVAAALLLLALFRKQLLAPDPEPPQPPPPPPPPRCGHCNGLVAAGDATCSHCGAKL